MSALNTEQLQTLLSYFKCLWKPSVSFREGAHKHASLPLVPPRSPQNPVKASSIVRDRIPSSGAQSTFFFLFFFFSTRKPENFWAINLALPSVFKLIKFYFSFYPLSKSILITTLVGHIGFSRVLNLVLVFSWGLYQKYQWAIYGAQKVLYLALFPLYINNRVEHSSVPTSVVM